MSCARVSGAFRGVVLGILAVTPGGYSQRCAVAATTPGAEQRQLERLYAAYWHDWLALNPEEALNEGVTAYEAEFDDSLEDSWLRSMRAMLHRYDAALKHYDPALLSADDRISYAVLRYQLDSALAFYATDLYATARMLPINQFVGQHTAFALDQAGSGSYPFKTVGDYDHALARADRFARWAEDAIARMREGMAKGVVLPRVVVERVLPQLKNHSGGAPETTEFWRPIAELPAGFSAADKARLTHAYARKIRAVIEPTFLRLYDFLAREYLPRANAMPGLGALPNGAALYSYEIRANTTTEMTPAEIHALGLEEVERISAELDEVRSQVGFAGTLPEFFAFVRANASLHFASPDEIVPAYQAALQRILPTLPQLFDVMPKASFEIRALPESAKNYQGNGNYQQAAADGSRPGILWMNIYAPGVRDTFIVMTTTLHETYPGHHFQTSLAAEIPHLPAFRRMTFFNAYGEGWALYCESLGEELGLYDDPWQRYGHLVNEMLRASRLVIDTGIHAMGWTTEQGIDWMTTHSSMDHAQAAAEVERYVAYPAQAVSYKIGQLDVSRLRAEARRELGPRFDVRRFHDEVLLGGSLPLVVLDEKVERWIAATKSAAAAPEPTP